MKRLKFFLKIIAGILLILACAVPAVARVRYVDASKFGMVPDDETKAAYNCSCLKSAVAQKKNVLLDGTYFFSFDSPIILDHPFYLKGGEMCVVRGSAFDFDDGGGFHAENVVIRRINVNEAAPFCGSRAKHSAICLEGFSFENSAYYGRHLFRLLFEDIDGSKVRFGIKSVVVSDSYLNSGACVTVLNAVVWDKCSFTGNKYESFPITPINVYYSHSKTLNPQEKDAYQFVEQNISRSCPIYIERNTFIGKTVSYNYYYCSALVRMPICYFRNNYLKDMVNVADGSTDMENATCYDAYLSCREVYFENNVIENLISYTKNGAEKPQCEIGKSKGSGIKWPGQKIVRHYENNKYTLDGSKFLSEGADRESLYTNIFGNTAYVDDYVWNNNMVEYIDADLSGRSSSIGYGSFEMRGNFFKVDRILGNGLCMLNSGEDFLNVNISDNMFKLRENVPFTLFNQVYKEDYKKCSLGSVSIVRNVFQGSCPLIYFFSGQEVTVTDNEFDPCVPNTTYYVSNYTGKRTLMNIKKMNVILPFQSKKDDSFRMTANLSDNMHGTFEQSLGDLTNKSQMLGYYYWKDDADFSFIIDYILNGGRVIKDCRITIRSDKATCNVGAKVFTLNDGWTIVYSADGIVFRLKSNKGEKCITYQVVGKNASVSAGKQMVLRYVG